VIARFETFTGLFPYHCHILEHEDHEMMRQMRIIPRGDVDEDGDVDQDDLDMVLFYFGQSVTPWTGGDLDGDGDVDQDDLDLLLFSFGET